MLYPINQSGIPLATERLISRLHIFRTTQPTLTGGTVTLKKFARNGKVIVAYSIGYVPTPLYSSLSV